ncbi:expressed unknown protein [Seminavis robusta]|uniref:MYND-type domain-containing protein n=1 Tax=Seminavis robusta TaxID=568900 RepID=A0A9N8HE43_9STRA|nr:expressed unknown protein [Seminavis robusta]|eukprot:Sro495_g154390.1 n/a (547) ;mRNA; r:9719-11453
MSAPGAFFSAKKVISTLDESEQHLNSRGFGPLSASGYDGPHRRCQEWSALLKFGEDINKERKRAKHVIRVKTLLDAVEETKARFLSISRFTSMGKPREAIGFLTVDNFRLMGTRIDRITKRKMPRHFNLLKPLTYGVTYRCTSRALEYFLPSASWQRFDAVKRPEELEKLLVKIANDNQDLLIILEYRSVHSSSESVALLIDCLPILQSPQEKEMARKLGFMQALAEEADKALNDPAGREAACCMLATGTLCGSHGSCSHSTGSSTPCNGKSAERGNSIHTDILLQSSNSHQNQQKTEKILHMDLFFPDCLPNSWKLKFDWLKDERLRRKCIRLVLMGRLQQDRKVTSPIDVTGFGRIMNRDEATRCCGFDDTSPMREYINGILDKTNEDEFFVGIHYGIRKGPEKDVVAGCFGPGLEAKLLCRTYKFQRPRLIAHDPQQKGEKRLFSLDLRRLRKCANCGKYELITGSFHRCKVCKRAAYCNRVCQGSHWESTHKEECGYAYAEENDNKICSNFKLPLVTRLATGVRRKMKKSLPLPTASRVASF